LTSCQGLEGKITLEAIESELLGSEVYDKVAFIAPDSTTNETGCRL
jgi:hypothetical protein